MELKDYQIKMLDYLDSYLAELKTQKTEKQECNASDELGLGSSTNNGIMRR